MTCVFWPSLPSHVSMYIMITIELVLLCFMIYKSRTFKGKSGLVYPIIGSHALSGAIAGIVWMASVGYFYTAWQLPEDKIQQDVIVSGQVIDALCRQSEKEGGPDKGYASYLVNVKKLHHRDATTLFSLPKGSILNGLPFVDDIATAIGFRVALNANDSAPCLREGDTFSAIVKLKPTYAKANPVGADRQRILVSKRVSATGYVKAFHPESISHNHTVRQHLIDFLELLPLKNTAWWKALLLGQRNGLTDIDWITLQRTGTGHLFSVSGMHLSVVAGASMLFLNITFYMFIKLVSPLTSNIAFNTTRYWSRRKHKGHFWFAPLRASILCAVILTGLGYAIICGAALPVIRAWVLLTLVCTLSLFKVVWRPFHMGLVMLALCLILFPLSVLSASFYLSVGALFIIWFFVLRFSLNGNNALKAMFKLQCGLTITMLPITFIWFESASIVSILANLIALPMVTVMLPICLFILLLLYLLNVLFEAPSLLSHVLTLSFEYADIALGFVLHILTLLAELEFSAMSLFLKTEAAIAILAAVFVALLPKWRFKYLCVVALIVPFLTSFIHTNETLWELHVFDAGQASAVAITKGKRAMVIDTGASYNGKATIASNVLLPFLKKRNIQYIDFVIHTHSDNDHAGGFDEVSQSRLARYADFYLPVSTSKHIKACEQGQSFSWQALNIDFMWPKKGNAKDNNASSCVVKISDDSTRILIPGDIEKASEYALLTHYLDASKGGDAEKTVAADILLAPHHGSNTSSTDIFIEQVKPRVVIFTQGYENRWKFPSKAVYQRYLNHGVKPYMTSYHGYINATVDGVNVSVKTQRFDLEKRWYLAPRMPSHL